MEHYGGRREIMFVTDIGSSFLGGWKWRVKKLTEWGRGRSKQRNNWFFGLRCRVGGSE